MRTVAARGCWLWSLSGLVVIAMIAISVGVLVTRAGSHGDPPATALPTRTLTISQRVTSLDVRSYGALIHVTGAPVRRVQVIETIRFGDGSPFPGPPVVTQTVVDGRLTLAAPACGISDCSVAFSVTAPSDVAVTAASDGGPVIVSGVAAANVDSGGGLVRVTGIRDTLTVSTEGGPVLGSGIPGGDLDSGGGLVGATDVRGPLTVSTEGGPLTLNGLTGPLDADTGGGPLLARGVAAVAATVRTGGAPADMRFTTAPQAVTVITGGGVAGLWFAAAPRAVTVSTDGGPATVIVPGGPYALTADSGSGPVTVGVAINPAARRSINVSSGGGPLEILAPGGP